MEIRKTTNHHTLTVSISGRVDTLTAPVLEQELKNSLTDITELILDFTEVEYISSAGLRVLLFAHKTMQKQGSMKLVHVTKDVLEILEMTGFISALTIE